MNRAPGVLAPLQRRHLRAGNLTSLQVSSAQCLPAERRSRHHNESHWCDLLPGSRQRSSADSAPGLIFHQVRAPPSHQTGCAEATSRKSALTAATPNSRPTLDPPQPAAVGHSSGQHRKRSLAAAVEPGMGPLDRLTAVVRRCSARSGSGDRASPRSAPRSATTPRSPVSGDLASCLVAHPVAGAQGRRPKGARSIRGPQAGEGRTGESREPSLTPRPQRTPPWRTPLPTRPDEAGDHSRSAHQ
jgi:hypothetical protein